MRVTLIAAMLFFMALVAFGLIAALYGRGAPEQDLEAQALQIEKQLLCPQCTNKRLDVCELQICKDMRALIRDRLAVGSSPDDIILFFSNRYGDSVRADLQASGFNLFLFAWVGCSLFLTAGVAGWMLLRLRRSAVPQPFDSLTGVDEQWLDSQIGKEVSE